MNEGFDAIVLGADAQSLIAAATLARGGARTLVLGKPAPPALPLVALDPVVVKELGLARHGLHYSVRDMMSIGVHPGGHHLPLPRDLHAAGRSLRRHAPGDAVQWARFRREMFRLARSLRKYWWDEESLGPLAAEVEKLSVLSAASWLNAHLESDALKALIAFDVVLGGMSPHAPGSALALVWRAAQEVGGIQGAKVMPIGGESRFMDVLEKAARHAGAVLDRERVPVRIRATNCGVEGVELAGGEFIPARAIISGLSRHRTLTQFLARGVAGFEALVSSRPAALVPLRMGITLPHMPMLQGEQYPLTAHFVLAEKLEAFAAAEGAVRAGMAPHEPVIAFTVDGNRLSLLVWPAAENDMEASILAALEPAISGARAAAVDYVFPCEGDPVTAKRLLASPRQRILTPVSGLYLCGAEPMETLSGRAARQAAHFGLIRLKEKAAA